MEESLLSPKFVIGEDFFPEETDVAFDKTEEVRISNEEWFEISFLLECHHAVFYKVWQMGRPIFNADIPTAAVQFDEHGEFIWFHFNPQFWKRLQMKDKLFVLCHEALHIILNHGSRTMGAGRRNHSATNVAIDIVVNHSLVSNFGFERKDIEGWQDYCWVDTVFADKKPLPRTDEMFEHYYNLFEKVYGDGGCGTGDGDGPQTVDDHGMLGEGSWDKAIDILNESLTDEEKEGLKGIVEKHFREKEKKEREAKNQQAGSGTGSWVFITGKKLPKKSKWETVIKKWSRKYMNPIDSEVEQWTRLNRRLSMLPKDMFLPSEMEVEDGDFEKKMIGVWFFLDTSGSCWNLKDRFFKAAETLPTDRFEVRLFCFDTSVQETTLESRKVYGGGGTAFDIMEKEIQKQMTGDGIEYPEAVFVITDGYGNKVKPEMPDRWHWFITDGGIKTYIDEKCNFYSLRDYE